jgi:hypothetical protein
MITPEGIQNATYLATITFSLLIIGVSILLILSRKTKNSK